MFTTLIDKILTKLQANDLIQESYKYEADQFKGDPVAVVTPSSNESDYNTTGENIRIYSFSVKLFVSLSDRDRATADDVLRELVDSVIDDFDADYTFSGLTVPSGYMFINVFAVPSIWGYSGREDEYRVAEIIIRCRARVLVDSIG